MNHIAGHYKTSLSGEMAYKSFVPSPLPPVPPLELTEGIVNLLVKANSRLAVTISKVFRSRKQGEILRFLLHFS